MKSPDAFEENMVAPCGMDCMVCYMHANPRKRGKSCAGCLSGDHCMPPHCRACKIKDCVTAKGLTRCFECADMPCKLVKNMDKSYRKRYRTSLVENNLAMREHGVSRFMIQEREKWTCGHCGGLISLHDGICTECDKCI